jgi:dolichol kinase
MPAHSLERPSSSIVVDRQPAIQLPGRALGVQEWRRRAWHFFPGVLAFAMTQIPHEDPIPLLPLSVGVILGLGLIVWGAFRFHHTFRRSQDERPVVMALGYALPIIALLYLLRDHLEVALAATAIIAFGDGSATLAGMRLGGPALPWNREKTLSGTAAFIVCGGLAASLVYWIEASPDVSYITAAALTIPAAIACALLESVPWQVNDNAVVGAAAATILAASQLLLTG